MEIIYNSQNYNKNNICRICMQDGGNLYPIFKEIFLGNRTTTIAQIITECTKYPVTHNDQLPAQICNGCMEAARNAHQFKSQTEEAYCQLKALYDITWIPKQEKGSGCIRSAAAATVRVSALTTDKYTQTEKSTVFQCECCPKKFFVESELRQHRATIHVNDAKKCRVCGETFNHLGQLKVHLSTEHPSEGIRCDFKCNICSREFTRKDHLKRHLIRVHKIEDDKLNISKVSLDEPEIENPPQLSASLNNYSSHWPDYQEDDDNEATAPNETMAATNPFSSEDEGLEHHNFNDMDEEDVKQFVETIAHPEISIKEEPNDIFDAYSYDDIDDNRNEPETIVPEDDDDDDEYMMNSDDYDRQYTFPATKIPKIDAVKPNTGFNNKYQRNPQTNMFHCVECLLEFKLQRNLIRHMLTHTDDRPFTCHLCLKSFKRKDNLQKHLRDVHAEKQFACDKCDKKFATHRQLCRHNQTSRHIRIK
ncbi:zinc finger protein 90-like isoform X2 [Lucilia sericata]|uniref:zinc finger protein 90-like isoform X2 n=1 Tax=Lucilia sericata TaxID=13632 RepID=UPI0018A7FF8C|nr:zinc finger protein 90-like isoform X2 [Lucilia sericata]